MGSNDDYIYAVNPDGSQKWRFNTGGPELGCSPAIGSDGTVYISSNYGTLYALNPDGTVKWSYNIGHGSSGSFAIGSDGTIYVGTELSILYAINSDGTLKWSYTTGLNIAQVSPVIAADGTVYIGSADYKFYAINTDGTFGWSFTTGAGVISTAALGSDGTIYVGSDDNILYALNSDGTLKWSYTTGGSVRGSPTISSNGTVYIGSNDGKLYAFDTGTSAGLADSPWPKFHHNMKNTGRAEEAVPSIVPVVSESVYPPVYGMPGTGCTGSGFGIDINVTDVSELFGTSFDLNYDLPQYVSIFSMDSIVPGPFLGTDLVFYYNTDTLAGTVSISVSRKSGVSGVSGSGTVARVKFTFKESMPLDTLVHFTLSNVVSVDSVGVDMTLESSTIATVSPSYKWVWPGDANNDGYVDQADILPIGVYWHDSGPERCNASRWWFAQACFTWDTPAATYADCDGNGFIDQADVLPIGINWHKSHSVLLASAGSAKISPAARLYAEALKLDIKPAGEGLYELSIALDPAYLSAFKGLSFAATGVEGVGIVSIEQGDAWSEQALYLCRQDNGIWGVGITETPNSSLGTVSGSRLVKILIRAGDIDIDAASIINISDLRVSLVTGEIVDLGTLAGQQAVRISLPRAFSLDQNTPNPFNPSTSISFSVPE
ncbi:MAG: PQQ-binding-like beta-propeller repeat protein, partial [Gemmatimonadota bacterium]|nr:PQQ-binding-like beta-propeller repeat protein [Gemmatimonadota bacterium]